MAETLPPVIATAAPEASVRTRPKRAAATGTPRWVKIFVILFVVLVVVFVILHLTGNGFGDHMHMSAIEHRWSAL